MNEIQSKFLDMKLGKLFSKLAIPNMISALVMSIYGIIDGIFVGKYIGGDALAGINLVMPVLMIAIALVDMFATGTSVQLSIKLGEKDNKSANSLFSSAMLIKFIYTILFMIFGFLFIDNIISLMGVSGEIAKLSMDYVKIYIMCSPIIMVSFALDNYLRVCGWATYSMIVNVSVSLLNILLDYLFIVKWNYGIEGAALASCIAMSLATIASIIPFILKKLVIHFTRPKMTLRQLKDIIFNGSSEFFSTITASLSAIIVNIVVVKLIGGIGVAAVGIIFYIDNIVISLMYGMGDGFQPAISYSYGAKNIKRVWAIIKYSIKAGFLTGVCIFIAVFFFKEYAISLFVNDEEVELFNLALSAMSIYMFTYLFSWLNTLSSRFFTALNKPIDSIVISLSHSFVLKVVGLMILPIFWGIDGVWFTFVIANALTFFLAIYLLVYRYKQMKCDKMLIGGNYEYKKSIR